MMGFFGRRSKRVTLAPPATPVAASDEKVRLVGAPSVDVGVSTELTFKTSHEVVAFVEAVLASVPAMVEGFTLNLSSPRAQGLLLVNGIMRRWNSASWRIGFNLTNSWDGLNGVRTSIHFTRS